MNTQTQRDSDTRRFVSIILSSGIVFQLVWLAAPVPARAQLPASAVILENVKIAEKQKSVDLCPVYLVPSDPKLPTWEYKGVKYRGSKPDARDRFFKDPDRYAKVAEKQRFLNNFMQQMSPIWCPVTDQVSAGGMTQFESCCSFCDDNVKEEDFPEAIKRLKARAEKTYALIGAKYTEGAKSPVEGAIRKPVAKTKQKS
jgi:hypothetical protein